jgi:hypothetical protein
VLTLGCIGIGVVLIALARRDPKPEQFQRQGSHGPSPANDSPCRADTI